MQRFLIPICLAVAIWAIGFKPANAQDAARGRALFETPFVAGAPSCSNAGCHASDPLRNQNRIRNGANPAAIQSAISSVPSMSFLIGRVSDQNRFDLAAYISNPTLPPQPVNVLQVTPLLLDFSNVTVEQSSSGRNIAIKNTGGTNLVVDVRSNADDFVVSAITCASPAALAPGETCFANLHFLPRAIGAHTGAVSVSYVGAPSTREVQASGVGTPSPMPVGDRKTMTEYRYAPLDYYFITSRETDKQLLDTTVGWERTGQSFSVFSRRVPNSEGLLRYYFDQAARAGTRGTHFYTLSDYEKRLLLPLNPTNALLPRVPFDEGIDSYAYLPATGNSSGPCAGFTLPVYRLFRGNSRFPDDPNHRFTTSKPIYDDLVSRGWDGEGVVMCVPPSP
jgi:Repeat of unknown function (DUF5648)